MGVLDFIALVLLFILLMSIIWLIASGKLTNMTARYKDMEVTIQNQNKTIQNLKKQNKLEYTLSNQKNDLIFYDDLDKMEKNKIDIKDKEIKKLQIQITKYKHDLNNVKNKLTRTTIFIEYRNIIHGVLTEFYKEINRIIIENGIEHISDADYSDKVSNLILNYEIMFNKELAKSSTKKLANKNIKQCIGLSYYIFEHKVTELMDTLREYSIEFHKVQQTIEDKLRVYSKKLDIKNKDVNHHNIPIFVNSLISILSKHRIKLLKKQSTLLMKEYDELIFLFLGAFLELLKKNIQELGEENSSDSNDKERDNENK